MQYQSKHIMPIPDIWITHRFQTSYKSSMSCTYTYIPCTEIAWSFNKERWAGLWSIEPPKGASRLRWAIIIIGFETIALKSWTLSLQKLTEVVSDSIKTSSNRASAEVRTQRCTLGNHVAQKFVLKHLNWGTLISRLTRGYRHNVVHIRAHAPAAYWSVAVSTKSSCKNPRVEKLRGFPLSGGGVRPPGSSDPARVESPVSFINVYALSL